MKNIIEYKGYYAKIEYSKEDNKLFGKIDGIDDTVIFSHESASEIVNEFHDAVDGYLEFCSAVGKTPNKTFKGSFNVRIDPELHKKLYQYALINEMSLNQAITEAVENLVKSVKDVENKYDFNNDVWGEILKASEESIAVANEIYVQYNHESYIYAYDESSDYIENEANIAAGQAA